MGSTTDRTNSICHFHSILTWVCIHPTNRTSFCPLWLLAFCRNRRSGWQDRSLPESRLSQKPYVRHFKAQRYTCFGVPVCSSDMAEAARYVCRPVEGCTLKACRSLVEVSSLVSVWHHLWHDFWVGPARSFHFSHTCPQPQRGCCKIHQTRFPPHRRIL